MRVSKILFAIFKSNVALTVLAFLILFPFQTATNCDPYAKQFHGYSFLDDPIYNTQDSLSTFFLEFKTSYEEHRKTQFVSRVAANVKEWQERFCGWVEEKDIHDVIYRSSLNDLKQLYSSIRSKNLPLHYRYEGNFFADYLKRAGCTETAQYLVFAKQCEPYVSRRSYWDKEGRNKEEMLDLAKEGTKQFLKMESHYIRLRFAYQIIRLAHYAKEYKLALEWFDYLMPKIDRQKPSIIYDWILAHKAGILKQVGRRTEAAHLNTVLFDRCPSCRESAFRSFSIKSQVEWDEAFLLCQTQQEQIAMIALRTWSDDAKTLEAMKEIYGKDPKSPYLKVFLSRELYRLEKNLMGLHFNDFRKENKQYFNIPNPKIGEYVVDLHSFVRQFVEEEKGADIPFWTLANGFLDLLSADYYDARRNLTQFRNTTRDKKLKKQADVFLLALEITQMDSLNDAVENKAYEWLQGDPFFKEYKDFEDFLKDKLRYLYLRDNESGKAFLMKYDMDILRMSPEMGVLDSLISLAQKERLNRLERSLVESKEGTPYLNTYYLIKGTQQLSEFRIEAAAETLRKIPRADRAEMDFFNPFKEHINDCVHCTILVDTNDFNRVELLDYMMELEYKGKADIDGGPRHFYELGLAYYNMSYYGYSWQLMDFFRSGANHYYRNPSNRYPQWGNPLGNREIKDVSKALEYFERTFKLAKDRDRDLAARAAFMATKCLQKQYFNSPEFKRLPGNQIPGLPEAYSGYFDVLVTEYKDTDFFDEVVSECKYFKAYASKFIDFSEPEPSLDEDEK